MPFVNLDNVKNVKCLPSVVFVICYNQSTSRKAIILNHKHKIYNLSASQQKLLLNIQNTLKVLGFYKPIPKYVHETLSLGSCNPVLINLMRMTFYVNQTIFLTFVKKIFMPSAFIFIEKSSLNNCMIVAKHTLFRLLLTILQAIDTAQDWQYGQ